MSHIIRSAGLPTGHLGLLAGGGYSGATEELDSLVYRAAEALRTAYPRNVTIRFNSDRRSGGAWLITHEVDGFGRNAEIGITFGYYPNPAHVTAAYAAHGAGFLATYRELRAYCDSLPRSIMINAYVGDASRIAPRTGNEPKTSSVNSIEAAIEYLAENAVLREKY